MADDDHNAGCDRPPDSNARASGNGSGYLDAVSQARDNVGKTREIPFKLKRRTLDTFYAHLASILMDKWTLGVVCPIIVRGAVRGGLCA